MRWTHWGTESKGRLGGNFRNLREFWGILPEARDGWMCGMVTTLEGMGREPEKSTSELPLLTVQREWHKEEKKEKGRQGGQRDVRRNQTLSEETRQ